MPAPTSPLRQAHRRQRPPGWRPWDLPESCLPGVEVPPRTEELFRRQVTETVYECWITSRKSMKISNVRHSIRHAAWRIYKSDAPPRFIDASCGEPDCVAPRHLIGADYLCAKGLHPMAPENQKLYSDGRVLCLACHLERWSKCKRGHDLDETGVRTSSGYRVCERCLLENSAKYHEENREEILQRRRNRYRSMDPDEKQRMLEERKLKYREKRARMTVAERAAEARKRSEQKRLRAAKGSGVGTDSTPEEGRTA